MRWSYRLATVSGIDVKVHATFVLIVLLAASHWSGHGWPGLLFGALLIVLLFACVTLHEFGHALAARHYGIPVRDIVLLPIGGVAFLGRQPRQPIQELLIAAAGPVVNLAIAAAIVPALALMNAPVVFTPALTSPDGATISATTALQWLLGANLGLVVFNLVPAFPMDGGRMLRGMLGLWVDWPRATRWAAATGQTLAVVMGAWGVLRGDLMLAFIAVMVFMTAGAAAAEERGHGVLASQRAGDACNRFALTLVESDRMSTVVDYLLTSYQPDFAVMRGGRLLGIVRRAHVIGAISPSSGDLPVSAIMTICPAIPADVSLAEARRLLVDAEAPVAAVFDGRGYLGLLSLDDIAEAETVLAFVHAGRIRLPAGRFARASHLPA